MHPPVDRRIDRFSQTVYQETTPLSEDRVLATRDYRVSLHEAIIIRDLMIIFTVVMMMDRLFLRCANS